MKDRFEELWIDYLEGDLGSAGLAELNRILESSPELRRLAADLYEEHRMLGVVSQQFDVDAFVRDVNMSIERDRDDFVTRVTGAVNAPPKKGRWPFHWLGSVLVAACVLVVSVGLGWLLFGGWGKSKVAPLTPRPDPSTAVATLLVSDGAVWKSKLVVLRGDRLPPQELSLSKGTAVVRFDCGASAILDGNCQMTLESRSVMRIARGNVTVHAPDEAYGFRVVTPSSEILDLGTEFHVNVGNGGDTALQVLDGMVQVQSVRPKGREPEVLGLGKSVVYTPDGHRKVGVPVANAKRFRERFFELRSPFVRRPLMADEPFDYPGGRRPLDKLSGGRGWAGPWRARRGEELQHFENDDGKDLHVAHDSAVFQAFGGKSVKRGGLVCVRNEELVRLRQLKQPIDLTKDATYYVAFLMKRERPTADRRQRGHRGRHSTAFRVTLRSSDNYWGHSISASFPISRRPAVQMQGVGRFSSPARFMRPVPLLWIVRIKGRAKGQDEVSARIYEADESISPVEPSLWTVESGGFWSDAKLDLVILTAKGHSAQWFDELRIGTTWESVLAGYGPND